MPCKYDSECSKNQTCSDGECVSIKKDPEGKTFSFKQAAYKYLREKEYERHRVDIYSKFLNDEIKDAIKAREEEAESTDFWGTVGAIGGGVVGCGVGFVAGGPGGCVAGATIGAGLGSAGARTIADANTFSEDTGISEAELAMLSPDDLRFLKTEFFDIRDEAEAIQADLDEYDDNEWKTHVLNVLSDTWTAYSVASTGTKLASMFPGTAAPDPLADSPVGPTPGSNIGLSRNILESPTGVHESIIESLGMSTGTHPLLRKD